MEMIIPQSLLMTSREIAELVESRHDKVKQSIGRLAARHAIDTPPMGEYLDGLGRPAQEYLLCKRDSYVVVAQLSPEFTARLVDRWQELEVIVAAPPAPVALSRMDLIQLALKAETENIALTAQLAAAAPAIAFVDNYVDSTGLKGFRQVCKLLRANEARFREFIEKKKIMYRLGGEWMPHAAHLDTGRFAVRAGTSDSNGHAFNSARFTPKGVNWVAGEWAKYQLEQSFEVHS